MPCKWHIIWHIDAMSCTVWQCATSFVTSLFRYHNMFDDRIGEQPWEYTRIIEEHVWRPHLGTTKTNMGIVKTKGVWCFRTFSVANEVCCLVSTGVRLVYITSFRFSYTWIRFSYSRCSSGFFAICGVLCIRGIPRELQHNC